MTGFPVCRRQDLDEHQRKFWDRITRGARGFYCGGPDSERVPDLYNAYVYFPAFGDAVLDTADALRAADELSGRFREIVVLTTSAELGVQPEFDFHVPFARDQGLSDSVIAAIGDRTTPDFMAPGDRIVYEANMQLLKSATLTEELRDEVVALMGYPGLMQLICAVSLYVTTAFVTNVARARLPENFSVDQKRLNDFYAGRSNG